MPTYKLTYFPNKGLAEPIRFLFNYANIDFVDVRLKDDEWLQLKPSTLFGQIPILEVDGKKINQSTAICRYLAKQFGLTGKNDWENLEIDATVDTINDLRIMISTTHRETNPEVKAQKDKAAGIAIPFFMNRLDEQVSVNGGFFVGGKLTWVDIVFAALLDTLNFRAGFDIIEKKENLKKLVEFVFKQPNIKIWLLKRPRTDY
ncbi:PREDICTED: glutathione S-transferase-like [Ceratosolen solmsi marchali]|uniref:glutathione transferase n=1 Tax=Ceratosolen solmsi marchali TaxID=326594 RepID=A0AAJ7DUP1_9HYME|nr:PREDICTED: glutathione S-transferase-like [Ceratosolen solmsi marchali]